LGTLAAGIAHDFNNLLTSMIGGAELLRQQTDDVSRREVTDMILAAGQQGARLCRQLQAYSGGSPLVREPCDLRSVIDEMLPTLVASVKSKLVVHLVPESESTVAMVDRGQFEQILLNLVQNSHEAGACHVWISIRGQVVDPEVVDGIGLNRAAVLQTVDDGSGMSNEVAQLIFAPFFTTKFPGRGLGLAVVFGGVRRHGGRVTVDCPETGGARFTIYLPLAGKDVAVPNAPRRPAGAVAAISLPESVAVIVVDDEPIVRVALTSMLRRLGINAHVFADGESALAYVAALPDGHACIALVDLTMPGMDGTEVIRQLRLTTKLLRCVLMSGHADDYVEECARQIQPERLLAKPFLIEEVRHVMKDLS